MPAPITINYDLDRGLFTQQPGQAPDTYQSSGISFAPVTLTPADNLLTIQINFIEGENGAAQELEMRTLGTGAAESLPSTFGTKVGSGHDFGPGLILGGPSITGFEGMNLKMTPTGVSGPLREDYAAFQSGSIAGHGVSNLFEFFFQGPSFGGAPDLLDDPHQPLRFTGVTLELEYAGGEPSVIIDNLMFNALSAELGVLRAPAQVERIDDPVGTTFLGDAGDNSQFGTPGFDRFFGRDGNDSFFGGDGPDIAYGGNGDDTLVMGAGFSAVYGEEGNDYIEALGAGGSVLHGQGGNDTIIGSFDNDVIQGGDGEDIITPSYGNDVLTGWNGNDLFSFRGDLRFAFRGIGDDLIDDFGRGDDTIVFERFELPGFASFADVAANLVDGPSGAVLTVLDEGTITFLGVPAASLTTVDFVFV
jgi:Ca2+-binding RTX toxin-like protein